MFPLGLGVECVDNYRMNSELLREVERSGQGVANEKFAQASSTLFGLPCHQAPQSGVRFRWVIERLKELLAVPIGQDNWCFFREAQLVLRDHARFANPQLVLVHLLNEAR